MAVITSHCTRSISFAKLYLAFAYFCIPSTHAELVFAKNLAVGQTSLDVKILQAYLASDKTLYPKGLVTGYYGFLTKAAVLKFQLKHKVISSSKNPGAGTFGPRTREKLNSLFQEK